MKRKCMALVLVLATVFVLAALSWLMPLSKTSQAAPAPSSDASFKGKVLLISTSNTWTIPFVLESVQLQKIGNHYWLTGNGVDSGPMVRLYKGRTVRLQMEHIVSITEFDDPKEAKKALASGGAMPFGVGMPTGLAPYAPATESAPTTPAPAAFPPEREKGLPPPAQKK